MISMPINTKGSPKRVVREAKVVGSILRTGDHHPRCRPETCKFLHTRCGLFHDGAVQQEYLLQNYHPPA